MRSPVATVATKFSTRALHVLQQRLEMAFNPPNKDSKEEKKEGIKQLAKKLCDDYIEDRLIRAGLQLKERKIGAKETAENEDTNRPSRASVSGTAWNRARSGSSLGGGMKPIPSNSKLTRSLSNLPPSLERKNRPNAHRLLPVDKRNPADISRLLVNVGETMELRHSGVYVEVLSQLNIHLISELTLKRAFTGVAKHLFSEGITWAKIVSLFAFAGGVAVDCVIHGANMYVGKVKTWTVQFISEELSDWLILQGGWSGLVDNFVQEPKSQFPAILLTFLSIAVILVAYLVSSFSSTSQER